MSDDVETPKWPHGFLWRVHAYGECICDPQGPRVDRGCALARDGLAEALQASVRVGGGA